MRLAARLLRPAANQTGNPGLWQDPVRGYFEQHGKMEFVAGEDYGLTQEQKQAVLDRHLVKEALKKEYARLEFSPHTYRYRQGVTMDPAVFRWYAADMTQVEHFRWNPKTAFMWIGVYIIGTLIAFKACTIPKDISDETCRSGELLWWDRPNSHFYTSVGVNNSGGESWGPF